MTTTITKTEIFELFKDQKKLNDFNKNYTNKYLKINNKSDPISKFISFETRPTTSGPVPYFIYNSLQFTGDFKKNIDGIEQLTFSENIEQLSDPNQIVPSQSNVVGDGNHQDKHVNVDGKEKEKEKEKDEDEDEEGEGESEGVGVGVGVGVGKGEGEGVGPQINWNEQNVKNLKFCNMNIYKGEKNNDTEYTIFKFSNYSFSSAAAIPKVLPRLASSAATLGYAALTRSNTYICMEKIATRICTTMTYKSLEKDYRSNNEIKEFAFCISKQKNVETYDSSGDHYEFIIDKMANIMVRVHINVLKNVENENELKTVNRNIYKKNYTYSDYDEEYTRDNKRNEYYLDEKNDDLYYKIEKKDNKIYKQYYEYINWEFVPQNKEDVTEDYIDYKNKNIADFYTMINKINKKYNVLLKKSLSQTLTEKDKTYMKKFENIILKLKSMINSMISTYFENVIHYLVNDLNNTRYIYLEKNTTHLDSKQFFAKIDQNNNRNDGDLFFLRFNLINLLPDYIRHNDVEKFKREFVTKMENSYSTIQEVDNKNIVTSYKPKLPFIETQDQETYTINNEKRKLFENKNFIMSSSIQKLYDNLIKLSKGEQITCSTNLSGFKRMFENLTSGTGGARSNKFKQKATKHKKNQTARRRRRVSRNPRSHKNPNNATRRRLRNK